ncbi:GNAT family N-acetyltransferase [Glutamicibacter sp. X7]
MNEISIRHLPEKQRYVLEDAGTQIGAAHYREVPGSTDEGTDRIFFHTVVDEAYGGQGLAGKLANYALTDTVAQGAQIVAVCPYIKAYVAKHHDFDAHLVKVAARHLAALPKD